MIYKMLTEGLFVLKIDQEKSFEYTEAKLEEREIERKESNQNSELEVVTLFRKEQPKENNT